MANNNNMTVPWRGVSRRRTIEQDPSVAWETFKGLKFEVNNYYAYWRLGIASLPGEPWTIAYTNRNPNAILYVDRYRRIRGQWENIYKINPPWRRGGRAKFEVDPNSRSYKSQQALNTAGSLQKALDRGAIPIRMLKMLGNGSMGVALLCDTPAAGPGLARKRFVLKADINGQETMGEERRYMMTLKRAAHISQMLRMSEIMPTIPLDMARSFESVESVQLLEFCKHGDLMTLLQKADGVPKGLDAVVRILRCLIRACFAMQYPPRRLIDADGNKVQAAQIGPNILETLPPPELRAECAYDLVHFDLDPQNILLGDLDDDEHRRMPVCKVADFGLAKRTISEDLFRPINAMGYRKVGKMDYPLPEQFHKEWEFVDILPHHQSPRPKVAGQYGPASNVFAIGLCMHSLITGASPPEPLEAVGPLNGPTPCNLLPARFYPILNLVTKREVEPFYTYGGALVEYAQTTDIGYVIVIFLLRCLADQPAHRPTADELEVFLQLLDSVRGGPPGQGSFYQKVFGAPPAPSPDIFTAFPDFRPFALDHQGPRRAIPGSQPGKTEDTRTQTTIWVGPARGQSAAPALAGGRNLPGFVAPPRSGSGPLWGPGAPLDPAALVAALQRLGPGGTGSAGTNSSESGGSVGSGAPSSSWLGTRPEQPAQAGHDLEAEHARSPSPGRESSIQEDPAQQQLSQSQEAAHHKASSQAASISRVVADTSGVSDDGHDSHNSIEGRELQTPVTPGNEAIITVTADDWSITNEPLNSGRGSPAAVAVSDPRTGREGSPPTRLARVLARLRLRSLPRGSAGEQRPHRSSRQAMRKDRVNVFKKVRLAPSRASALVDDLRNRFGLRRRRRSPSAQAQATHGPRLGPQQVSVPDPSVVADQAAHTPVIPARFNTAGSPLYLPVNGLPDLLEIVTRGGGMVGPVPSLNDSQLLAQAFAGRAVLSLESGGNIEVIWHAPPFLTSPIAGHLGPHWTALLGVQRYVYFYEVGSGGANAVLATLQQNYEF